MHKYFLRLSVCLFLAIALIPSANAALQAEFVADGFNDPLFLCAAPGDSTRLFIVEQGGLIKIIKNGVVLGTPFLDLTSKVNPGGGERGLLGLAFHPNYSSNGFFYVNYVDNTTYPGDTVVERYSVTGNPDLADFNSDFLILSFDQNETNHNGGWMGFGPNDGYLYIASGDGGPGDDPNNRGQDINSLLGKILRIDVDSGSPFANPSTNPFFGATPGNDSIWSYGLRNPWRCSFDRSTGDLWIADVGQSALEEVNFQDSASTGGENYGWKVAEGFECRGGGGTCGTNPGFTPPILDYPRTDGHSVTGGYVYRGTAIPSLQGTFFYGDYSFSNIWSLEYNGTIQNFTDRTTELEPAGARTINAISSFGEDADGELYIVDYNDGEIYKIVSDDPDTDGDGLTDVQEGLLGTNPNDPDSDNDLLDDGDEVNTYNTDPLDTDSDNDALTDGAEVITHSTDPNDSDSDNDGLQDGAEVNTHGTGPNDSDSDNDGLSDGAEVNTHGTLPLDTDTDNDGLTDGAEVNTHGTLPLDPDTDNDGLDDGDEITEGTNPFDTDSDNDGLTDGAEVNTHGSNPLATDSDGDGLSDNVEVTIYLSDPTVVDTDGDGAHDGTEVTYGTDPTDPMDFPPLPAFSQIGLVLLVALLSGLGAILMSRRARVVAARGRSHRN